MPPEDPTHTTEFEAEARERLAGLEAHQDNLQSKMEDVRDTQDDIADTLDSMDAKMVTEEQIQAIEDETASNTTNRKKRDAVKRAGVEAVLITTSVAGGIAGYVQFIA